MGVPPSPWVRALLTMDPNKNIYAHPRSQDWPFYNYMFLPLCHQCLQPTAFGNSAPRSHGGSTVQPSAPNCLAYIKSHVLTTRSSHSPSNGCINGQSSEAFWCAFSMSWALCSPKQIPQYCRFESTSTLTQDIDTTLL